MYLGSTPRNAYKLKKKIKKKIKKCNMTYHYHILVFKIFSEIY